jgi:transcriptional regulator with XRE-family HTH domain
LTKNLKISLKAARVNAGMTQEEVAKALGKGKQTIVNWESGRNELSARDLFRLSELYQVSMDNIFLP